MGLYEVKKSALSIKEGFLSFFGVMGRKVKEGILLEVMFE